MLRAKFPNGTQDELRSIIRAFVEAFALSIPSARKTTHNAHTRPGLVLATIQTGQPMQLVNAFESPIRANGHGYEEPSIDRLLTHKKTQDAIWGLSYDLEVSVPRVPFVELLNQVVAHV